MTIHLAPTLAALLLGLAQAASVSAQTQAPSPADARSVALVDIAEPAPATPQVVAADAAAVDAAAAAPAQPEPRHVRRIDIGGATQTLLELQRSAPAVHARSIDGEQASRSYQRYLKSFETTIPEHYNTGLGLAKQ